MDCEFRMHGERDVEVQLLLDGHLQLGMIAASMRAAQQLARREQERLERAGWRDRG